MKENPFLKILKRSAYIISALLASICLFSALVSFGINKTVMNPEYHKNLFEKVDVYSHTHEVVKTSMKEMVKNLKKTSSGFEQHSYTFDMLEKSITPEMVKRNLDSMREEFFQYFEGERSLLPDIYLKIKPDGQSIPASVTGTNSTVDMLTKLDKINLSAILLYMNRSDISDMIFILKFIYYAASVVPTFSILAFLFFVLAGAALCRKLINAAKWLVLHVVSCGALCVIFGLGLLGYGYLLMPKLIYPITMSLPLQNDVITSYIRSCINSMSIFLLITGGLLLLVSLGLSFMPKRFGSVFYANECGDMQNNRQKLMRITKISVCCTVFVILLAAAIMKVDAVDSYYEENQFSIAVSKMKSADTDMEVISAENENIYNLNVKLVDKETGTPVKYTNIIIDGKSSESGKVFNKAIKTDDAGVSKFPLDKGVFRISFSAENFPAQYHMPASLYVNLKEAGTTIFTVSLEKLKTDKSASGIVEVEILGRGNRPVPNLELKIESITSKSGIPDNLFSYTNLDGIAVFRVVQGSYKVSFIEEKFPSVYLVPASFDTVAVPDSVSRYTIRLVNRKSSNALEKQN